MQQIKFFKGVEAELSAFETEVNEWLASLQQAGGRVIEVEGNIAPQTVSTEKKSGMGGFSPSDLFVVILYEPGS